jgi:hypothetical protein
MTISIHGFWLGVIAGIGGIIALVIIVMIILAIIFLTKFH